MALEILTTNAAGDGWVDALPGAVSTGYQAQNDNITARSLGLDSITLEDTGTAYRAPAGSGVVDVAGVPYANTTESLLGEINTASVLWPVVEDGPTPLEKELEWTSAPPIWDPIKNYYTSSITGKRLLGLVQCVDFNFAEPTFRHTRRPLPNREGSFSGIGHGGERFFWNEFGDNVQQRLYIAHDGVYEMFAISPGDEGGNGGWSALLTVRLKAGEYLTVSIVSDGINPTGSAVILTSLDGATAAVSAGPTLASTSTSRTALEAKSNIGGQPVSYTTESPAPIVTVKAAGGWCGSAL